MNATQNDADEWKPWIEKALVKLEAEKIASRYANWQQRCETLQAEADGREGSIQ